MSSLFAILAGLLLLGGAGFGLVGALGVLRLPDVYTRMHAASKAGTVGSGLCLLAVAVNVTDVAVTTRAIAGVAFFILTAPISAHLLSRAALLAGYAPIGGAGGFPIGKGRRAAATGKTVIRQEDR